MNKENTFWIIILVVVFGLVSACSSDADYKALEKENNQLRNEINIVKTKLDDSRITIKRYEKLNSSLKTKLEQLKNEKELNTTSNLEPHLLDVNSTELRTLLSSVPYVTYPIEVEEYVAKYFDIDSINYKDTSFVYYSSLQEKVRFEKEVIAYENYSFESDNFSLPKKLKLNKMFQGFIKLPLAYAVSKEYIMILFLHTPTDEYSSATISAVYYKKDGELIYHENLYTKEKEPYVECFKTSTIDLSIITLNTILNSDTQLNVVRTSFTNERELAKWLQEDEPDIDFDTIPELVIEERVMKIKISPNSKKQQIVLSEEKIEFP